MSPAAKGESSLMETGLAEEIAPKATYEFSSKTSSGRGSRDEMEQKVMKFHKKPQPKAKTGWARSPRTKPVTSKQKIKMRYSSMLS